MQRIGDQDEDFRTVALKALSWLVYAYRSLSIGELQHALLTEAGTHQLDEEAIMDGQSITACCAGLAVIDQVSDIKTVGCDSHPHTWRLGTVSMKFTEDFSHAVLEQ